MATLTEICSRRSTTTGRVSRRRGRRRMFARSIKLLQLFLSLRRSSWSLRSFP